MNFRDKTLIRILIIIAKIVSDEKWHKEIETLGTHISVNAKEHGL